MGSMLQTHLLVLIHGMWGNPSHLAEMNRIITKKYAKTEDSQASLTVLVSQTNREQSTYDGIDWGGERIAEEVEDIEHDGTTKVTKFSAVGYSLGGLLARYVLGVLLTRKFFDKVEPVNFATFATPHFGLPRYGTFRSLLAHLGPYFLSRTGEHFYTVDQWGGTGRPLLEVMADKDRVFFQALSLFPHIDIYANAVNDTTVPYVTAALESEDPFMGHETNGIEIHFDDNYEPLIKSFYLSSSPPHIPRPLVLSLQWFRQLQPSRPLFTPALQFRFPLNILFCMLFPLLFPIFVITLALRLGFDARASRARIRLLETDPSGGDRLINMLRNIDKEVDDVVADILDDPPQSPDSGSDVVAKPRRPEPYIKQVALTPTQQNILTSLNSLPQLRKHRAFIHPVRNSHPVLISRDVQKFTLHKRGEGVLQHWADRFDF